jgi:phosphoadenosine phosphosulfate reductase
MDEQLYLMAIGLSLKEKVEIAIATLRHWEYKALEFDSVGGYRCGDSYGKDSCVVRHLCRMSGVKFRGIHNLTTMDSGELIRFGMKHHPDTTILRPAMPMMKMLVENARGMPTRRLAWCCEHYKHASMHNDGGVYVLGIRHAESKARVKRWKIMTPMDRGERIVVNPILYWTDNDLWTFIRSDGIHYCDLYDQGFDRLGCVGCPKSSNRAKEFSRWPRYEASWKRACQRWFERWHNTPKLDGGDRWTHKHEFTCWQDLWRWWMEELPEPEDDDCQMGLF